MRVQNLKCKECRSTYPVGAIYACERCFGPLEVAYPELEYGAEELKQRILAGPHTLWRYADFLPTEPAEGSLPAGMTPLIRASRLAAELGVKEVWVKNDAANPSHSFKDRVVSVALSCAQELGFTEVACASTGNLANAVAAASSALGLTHHVLVPASLERHKLIASEIYGPGLIRVAGNYDQINRLSCQLADELGWGFVNINLRPYYAEGSKTLAYEVAEQLGFRLPSRVVCPIASGSLYTKIAYGFREWQDLGLADGELPIMCGAQPEGCSPVAQAFEDGEDFCQPVKPETVVTSLAIGNPADGSYALKTARETGGVIGAVSEDEMRAGVSLLARTTGVFAEAAGGVTTALLYRLAQEGCLDPDEEVVLYITGSGLKTAETVSNGDFLAPTIEPTYASYEQLIS